jgi:hypothetical protein
MLSIKKTVFHHLFFTFLCLQCNKLNTMNHAIQLQTNNCRSPQQIFMQNTSLARVATLTDHITNTNIQLYPYNQPINNFNQNIQLYTNKQTYPCTYCKKKYVLKKSLAVHIERKHEKQRDHICSSCNKGFFMKSHLNAHIKTHIPAKLYTCEICNKKYKTRGSLRVHVKKCNPIKLSLESFKDADSLFNIHDILYSPDQELLNDTTFSMWADNI